MKKGSKAKKRKERKFLKLAKEFRRSSDPQEIKSLGDRLGWLIFDER